jgi:RND family efflux transporter MFP subunit
MIKCLKSVSLLPVAIVFFSLALCCCTSDAFQPKNGSAIKVTIETVKGSDAMNTMNYVGVVEEKSSVALSFSSMGTIEQIYVSEGTLVTKGQLLARLDPTAAKNLFDATVSTLKQAQDGYKRLKSIYDAGSLPEVQMVEMETKLQQAQSTYNIVKKGLEDCSLYAPISGIIGKKTAETGENTIVGKPALTILDISSVKVKFSVPENEISVITPACKSVITVAALGDKEFSGGSLEKNVVANSVSHTYPAFITLPNPRKELLPGMVCRVGIRINGDSRGIVVPIGIVMAMADGRNFVWGEKEGMAKRIFVTTGEAKGNGVEIQSGLLPGDRIITEGYQKISEGDKIIGK